MAGLGYDIKWMAIIDVMEGGFAKELVGIIKYDKKIIQMEVILNENYNERD